MKKLIVSIKSASEALEDFKKAASAVQARTAKGTHYEISFDTRREFERFTRHMNILTYILIYKPRSVYELSKLCNMDLSNLNKLIAFYERVGAVRIEGDVVDGRTVKRPVVDYDRVELNLKNMGDRSLSQAI